MIHRTTTPAITSTTIPISKTKIQIKTWIKKNWANTVIVIGVMLIATGTLFYDTDYKRRVFYSGVYPGIELSPLWKSLIITGSGLIVLGAINFKKRN